MKKSIPFFKIYFKPLILMTLSILFVSCTKRYIGTRTICEKSLYAEIYEINPAGMDACYLTDSANFRFYVGKFDPESGNYSFECKGDSIVIYKVNGVGYVKSRINVLNLDVLCKQHKFE
jgi:hypothetical protein